MLNLLRNSINAIKKVSGLDSDASAFITAAGLTDATQKDAINTLVKDMKASGLWSKMKAVYPMVGGTATSMKFNLKDPRDLDAAFRLTWSGGWTYSATGATPNGTNAYADTKFIQENNWSSNTNAAMGIYLRTDVSSLGVDIGALGNSGSGSNGSAIYAKYNAVTYAALNSSGVSSITNNSATGFYAISKNVSGSFKLYKFGTNSYNTTVTQASSTNINKSIYLGAANDVSASGAASYSQRQQAFAFISDYLSEQDILVFNQIVEKYQVALSRGVQAAQSFYYNSAYSNEANTYLYSTQITGTTQVSAINTLINGLKANNLWSKMKAVYPFVTDKTLQSDMAAQMKFNLVNPQDSDAAFRLAFSGGWTYSTNGAQPNGTNAYADTKLIPSSVLTGDNVHISYYSRTNSAVASSSTMGSVSATDTLRLIIRRTSDIAYSLIGSASKGLSQFTVTDSRGLFIANAPNSSTRDLYKNSSSLTPVSQSGLGINGTPNVNMYLSAYYSGVAAFEYDNKECAFATIGDGLTNAEIAIFYNLIQAYQTTLSRQV